MAWTSQEKLAYEMKVALPTVERLFAWAKKLGIVNVERIRTGRLPSEQFNRYSLIIERLRQIQRPPHQKEHPSPVMDDASPNTHHLTTEHPSFAQGTPITHDGKVLVVKQCVSKADSNLMIDSPASGKVTAKVTTSMFDTGRSPKDLLLRFADHFRYSIEEADARLGWIFSRLSLRKRPVPVNHLWNYILAANRNLDNQHADDDYVLESYSFAQMHGFELSELSD